jgi:solute carrier family 7 (L-type amino acid transporter), member 9/15
MKIDIHVCLDRQIKVYEAVALTRVALFVSVVILVINCYSVNLATGVQNVFTAAKMVAIFIIICGGMYKLAEGESNFQTL